MKSVGSRNIILDYYIHTWWWWW